MDEARILPLKSLPALVGNIRRSRVLATVAGGVSVQILTLVSGAVVARMLGVEGRGFYAAVTLLPLLFISLGDLGIPLAYAVQTAEGRVDVKTLAANAKALTVVQSVLLVILLLALTPLVIGDESSLRLYSILFGLVAIPTQLLHKYTVAILQGSGQVYRFNFYRNLTALVNSGGLIVLILADRGSLATALGVWLIGSIVACGVSSLSVFRRCWPLPPLDRSVARSSLNYGLRAHLGNVAPIDSFRVDLIFVVALLSAEDAGLYSVALAVANTLRGHAVNMGLLTVPSVVRESDVNQKMAVARRYARMTIAMIGAIALFLFVFADFLVRLVYGADFSPAAGTTRLLLVAMVIASLKQLVGDLLRSLGAPGIGSIAEVTSWVTVAALFPLLIPTYGLTGAAGSVICAYTTSLVVSLVLARNQGWDMLRLMVRNTVTSAGS